MLLLIEDKGAKIENWAQKENTTKWPTIDPCRISRSPDRTQNLLSLDKESFWVTVWSDESLNVLVKMFKERRRRRRKYTASSMHRLQCINKHSSILNLLRFVQISSWFLQERNVNSYKYFGLWKLGFRTSQWN